MAISEADVELKKFLQFFTTITNPEAGKIQLQDADFVICAALLKLCNEIRRLQ